MSPAIGWVSPFHESVGNIVFWMALTLPTLEESPGPTVGGRGGSTWMGLAGPVGEGREWEGRGRLGRG